MVTLGIDVRAGGHRRGVAADRAGGAGVGTAVEQDARPLAHQSPVAVGGGAVVQPHGVPVHVAEERLLAAVDHLDRTAGVERQQADVHLQAHVLAAAERPTDAAQGDRHLLGLECQAGGDLLAVGMQVLRRHPQQHAALAVRHRQRGLGAEEGLVLGADDVRLLDSDLALDLRVTLLDVDPAVQVAVGVQRRPDQRLLGVDHRLEPFPHHRDGGTGVPGSAQRGRGDRGHRLAVEARHVSGEHRLVRDVEPVGRPPRHVPRREHRDHAGDVESRRQVERHEPGVRVRAAQHGAPEHVRLGQVTGEDEAPRRLRQPVRAQRARCRRRGSCRRSRAAARTASTMRP